jgi:hypothetical protein
LFLLSFGKIWSVHTLFLLFLLVLRGGSTGELGAPALLQLMHQWKMGRVREKKWWRKEEK